MNPRPFIYFLLTLAVDCATHCYAQISIFPYVQNFDSVAIPTLPPGWSSTQNRVPGINDFSTATTTPRSIPNSVGSTNATIAQSLISPLFDFVGVTPDTLRFYTRRSATHNARMLVEASLDSGNSYPLLLSDSLTNTAPTTYVQTKLLLPTILTSSHAVKFRWRIVADGSGNTGTLRIDDISISAFQPIDLALTRIQFQPLTATEGDSIQSIAKIKNVGQENVQNFSVEFYVDTNNDSIPQPPELRATVLNSAILAVSDSVELTGRVGTFPAGQKLVIVKIVYAPDQNLSNNQLSAILNVGYTVRSVVINENMYAPTSPEPEWVELLNTRADSISLKNWLIADSNRTFRVITTQEMKIAPGGYVVLTGNPSAFLNIHPNTGSPIVGVTSFPALNNGADAVILYDNRSVAMDSVRYVSSWGGNTGGRSLERIDPLGSSTIQTNWGTSRSTNRSTPGERNSLTRKDRDLSVDSLQTGPALPLIGDNARVFVPIKNIGRESVSSFTVSLFEDANADSLPQPGELIGTIPYSVPLPPLDSITVMFDVGSVLTNKFVIARVEYAADEDTMNNIRFGRIVVGYPSGSVRINEIMYAPTGTEQEWVEIFNTRSDSVNLKDWLVSDNIVTSKRVLTERNVILPPNNYVVLAKDSAALLEIHPDIAVRVINVANLPALNNSGDAVVLYDNRIATMDSVLFLSSWGGSNGNSLERIDPFGVSTQQSNWGTSRSSARSTPGMRNSLARKDRDLAVDSLRISPSLAVAGDSLIVVVPVRNPGRESIATFTVQLFRDVNSDSIPLPNELIGSIISMSMLAPLDSMIAAFTLSAVQAGTHFLIARLEFPGDEDTANSIRFARTIVGYPSGSVRINEIMYGPASGIPEWIELVNTRADTVDLGKWLLGNRSTSSRYEIASSGVHLPPNEYLVVTKDSALLHAAYPVSGSRVIQVSSLPTFLWNNSGDAVVLADNRRVIVDSVFYNSAWGGGGGKSLERIDALADANDSTNWATSNDSLGATPTRRNSHELLDHDLRAVRIVADTVAPGLNANLRVVIRNVGKNPSAQFNILLFNDTDGDSVGTSSEQFHQQAVAQSLAVRDSMVVLIDWVRPLSGIHQVIAQVNYDRDQRLSNNKAFSFVRVGYGERTFVINEVMYSPISESAEYVEFFNAGQSEVDVAQWKFHDRRVATSVNEYKLAAASKVILPGEYFVLASDSSILRMSPGFAEGRRLTILNQSSLSLNNDGDDIVLVDPSGFVIDSISYSPSWHSHNVTDKSGRSLEKINPLFPSNDPRNWSTCSQSVGGTPGVQNSIFAALLPPRSKLTVSPNPFSPDGDGWEDFAVIQYEVPLAVSMMRVRLYDAVGRRIRTLANNEPTGSRGSLVWDGLDDDKQKARIGIYILLLDAIDDRGGVIETAKGVVVLATKLR